MGLLSSLQVIFIALKVTELIAWSWWAVLIPAYLMVALWLIGVALFAAVVSSR